MSVILKALRSADKKEEIISTDIDSGFFQQAGSFKPKSENKAKKDLQPVIGRVIDEIPERLRIKKIHILAAVLILIVGIFVVMKTCKKSPTRYIPVAVETVPPDEAQRFDPQAQLLKNARDAFAAGNLDQSLNMFKEASEKDPNNAVVHNNLGLVLAKKGLYAEAASEYESALEIDENCAECLNNYGMLKSMMGDTAEAKRFLEEATEVSPRYADPYFNLGVLSEKSGDIKAAVTNYKTFIELYTNKTDGMVDKVKQRIIFLGGN